MTQRRAFKMDDLVSPNAVAALEVYPSQNDAPPRYQTNGFCGVVLIWTK